MMMILAALAACSAGDNYDDDYGFYGMPGGGDMLGGSGTVTAGSGELAEFTVDIDRTTAEPQSTATPRYDDATEDPLTENTFGTRVSIDLSNPTAKTENGVEVTVNGGHITANHGTQKGICYVLTGSTDNGSFTVVGDKKYEVLMTDVSITNPDSAALNLLSGKRAFIVTAGTNKITDGTTSKNSHKGALYCKGKLLFNGDGKLEVYGNYNNAIHSADYIVIEKGTNIYAKSTQNHGLKANDGIYINGGIVNVEVSAAAAKGINCESNIVVSGGRTTIVTTGNGTYDTEDREAKGSAGIKCDSTFTMYGGEVFLRSTGSGGKGISSDSICHIKGGTVRIITTGGQYSSNGDTASPKGIKADNNVVIDGGTVMIRTSGNNGEGIESKNQLIVNGGTVMVAAYDDAFNSASDMHINGGNIIAIGSNSDGLDANGNMYISGGNIVAYGAGGAESGIDVGEQSKLYITGGNIFGIGGRTDCTIGSTTQGILSASGSATANGTVSVSNGSTALAIFTMPPYSTSGTVMVSCPGLASGTSYTLTTGSGSQTVTASTSVSGMGGMGGGMGGGPAGPGRPGGGW